jgi:hypothetical protein
VASNYSVIGFVSSTNSSNNSAKSNHSFNPINIRTLSTDKEFNEGKPTLKYASMLTKSWASMSNEQILHFAHMDVPEACRECIIRDVMMVDQIEYDEVSVSCVCSSLSQINNVLLLTGKKMLW